MFILMGENNTFFTDGSFSLYHANTYSLLLSLADKSLSFAVVHDKQIMSFGLNLPLSELNTPQQLKELFASSFKKIVVGLPALALTLVPANLFDADQAQNFARLLDVKADEKVFVETLDDNNIIIYKTSALLAKLAEKFDFRNTVYDKYGWIKAIALSSPPGNNLYIDISNGKANYLYYFLGTLRYHNAFEFKNDAELVYYTTFVSNELNIKPQHTYIIMSGAVNTGDENMTRLKEFYPYVSLNPLLVTTVPNESDAHKYLALSGLSLCGSLEVA